MVAIKKTYLQRQPEIVENVLRALVEGLAFTWSPKSKSAALKSVARRLRITDTAIAEDGYQELLTRGGLEKRPHPSVEGMRNVQRLMQISNPRVGEVKLDDVLDRSLMALAGFRRLETFSFDLDVSYSHEAWRGRIRASAGVGASLSPEGVIVFDRELQALLAEKFPQEPLAVLHRIFAALGIAQNSVKALGSGLSITHGN